jgi:hypothetical protein
VILDLDKMPLQLHQKSVTYITTIRGEIAMYLIPKKQILKNISHMAPEVQS